jgi:hypothetical protein
MRLDKLTVIGAVIGVGLMTAACAEQRYIDYWEKPHAAEGAGFGDVHRQNMARHIVNPEPATPNDNEAAVEGTRVTLGTDAYMKNKVKQPRGVTTGGSSGGGSSGN